MDCEGLASQCPCRAYLHLPTSGFAGASSAPQRTAFYGLWGRNASEHSAASPSSWRRSRNPRKCRTSWCETTLAARPFRSPSAAREAGEIADARLARGGGGISKKGRFDLLTEYDLACERAIRERLEAAFPSHRIVGEEGAESGSGELVWYVDPIDGTTNFAHGHFFFASSIALYRGSEGLVGVVHAPALGVTWKAACKDGGARFETMKRCRVSARARLDEAVCATGFPYDRWTNPDNNHAELALFLQRARGVRRCGAASIDLCLVADGTYDIYWEKALNAWDMCAGALDRA